MVLSRRCRATIATRSMRQRGASRALQPMPRRLHPIEDGSLGESD
jgi:hypothetical protein